MEKKKKEKPGNRGGSFRSPRVKTKEGIFPLLGVMKMRGEESMALIGIQEAPWSKKIPMSEVEVSW